MDVTAVAPFSSVTCPSCGKHTRVKREFGPYTLVRVHAIGGMSVVFVAQDDALQREVALKILNETFSADEKRIAAFEQEARLTAAISHPHVVRVFTTGRAFDRFYIAMEFVSGGHLERRIRDGGALPEKEVLTLALQIADGLRAAHATGLIHRDIKPGNILLDEHGNAKIVDFGLALVTHGGSARAEEIWATPYYVPPEAIDGRSEDFRSDLYAFGATVYHALAGKPPCSEESMATALLREAKKRVVPLDQAAPWLGLETCAVVDRAMAYDPPARFQSYEELIAGLQSALRHAGSGAGPRPAAPGARVAQAAPAAARPQPRVARRTGERVALAGGALAVVAALGFAAWWMTRGDAPQPAAPAPTAAAGGGADTTPAVDHEGQLRVGRVYQAAHRALGQRAYQEAESRFAEVLGDPAAPEPTATVAGVESAVAALLDGRPGDARRRSAAVAGHVKGLGGGADAGVRLLGEASARVAEWPPVVPDGSAVAAPAELLRALLFALKDWEQGCFAEAGGWFRLVAEAPPGDEWGSVYRELAERHLADQKLLDAHDFDELPASLEACQELKDGIGAALDQLATKGRAVFTLRQRQLEIAHHARTLRRAAAAGEAAPPAPAAGLAELLPEVKRQVAESRFAEAAGALAPLAPADPAEAARRDAWAYLATAAAAFLDELAKGAAKGVAGVVLADRGGTVRYDRIAGATDDGLLLAQGAAEPAAVGWGKLAPDGLIELHQALVRAETDAARQQLRHEQAIAYDFLVGDRARATAAAERLGAANPAFGKRWAAAMKGLGE